MTNRITTEEAERIADRLTWFPEDEDRTRGAAALRSLAAERDELREEIGWLRVELADAQGKARESYGQGYGLGYAAGSGEYQP